MGRAKYEDYPPAFLTDVMVGDMRGIVQDHALRIAAKARLIAPRATGEYADSISAEVEVGEIGGLPRSIGIASAGTDHAIEVEIRFGTMMRAMGG